ncbi:endolytic transglycosylase MltG [Mycetocola reblochoni]|nr:endolytic transglycosylase MltG [Mycetocola reblochoni]
MSRAGATNGDPEDAGRANAPGAPEPSAPLPAAVAPANPTDQDHAAASVESLLGFTTAAATDAAAQGHAVDAAGAAASTGSGDSGGRDSRRRALSGDRPPRRRRRWLTPVIVVVAIIAVLGGGAAFAYTTFKPQIDAIASRFQPSDYEGTGTGEVVIQIVDGQDGADVAATLEENDVVMTSRAFYSLLLAQPTEVVFHAGTYRLKSQMSAQAALTALQDDANKLSNQFVIPEGTGIDDVLERIATGLDMDRDELEAAAADPQSFGLPDEATTLEGFLFPATYVIEPGTSATDVLQTLVDRSMQALDEAGVAADDRWDTVILASIVQREAGLAEDYPKVARVFLNRLDTAKWPSGLLQSDATVAYGTGNTHTVETTPEEREDASNPYNTYANPGLPVGPISNPGDVAIDAAIHPADGDWLYFVTWNLDTGETSFSTTYEEHEAAVTRWQEWMAANR